MVHTFFLNITENLSASLLNCWDRLKGPIALREDG